MKQVFINIAVSEELKAQLVRSAKEDKRPVSQYARIILEQHEEARYPSRGKDEN